MWAHIAHVILFIYNHVHHGQHVFDLFLLAN